MIYKYFKQFFLVFFLFIFLTEILLQIAFHSNIGFIKQPALFYNGFCDQEYWNILNKNVKYDNKISYHPILSIKKKEIFIPSSFSDDKAKKISDYNKKNIALYGSSFMDHKEFKPLLVKKKGLNFKNYSLGSYGLDQIYLSYKLTSHLNQNNLIVFGFLLEDLDRSLFNKRDYNKPKFNLENDIFKLTNVPISQENQDNRIYDLFLYNFIKNVIELLNNNFDSRLSECHINHKKKLFSFFLDDIMNEANKYNQKVIIITFNLLEDFTHKKSWRHSYIKNYLKNKNIVHIDSYEILNTKSKQKNEDFKSYFSSDLHNNSTSFRYIANQFFKVYRAM